MFLKNFRLPSLCKRLTGGNLRIGPQQTLVDKLDPPLKHRIHCPMV